MKRSTLDPKRQTMVIPVVTMEEVSILTDQERADFVASFKQAQADVAAGKAKPFNREEFKKRFLVICRGEITLTSAEQAEFIDSLDVPEAQIDVLKYEDEAFKDRLFDA
jgi:hypothetical protein